MHMVSKIDFKLKAITRGQKLTLYIDKASTHQEDITIINV